MPDTTAQDDTPAQNETAPIVIDGETFTRDTWGLLRDAHGRICSGYGDRFYDPEHPWAPPEPYVDLPADPREALPGLWQVAAWVWRSITQIWGGSTPLALGLTIARRDHTMLSSYIRALEALARRVILIAALTLQLAPARAVPPGWHRPHRFWRQLRDDPTSWRVAFTMALWPRPWSRPNQGRRAKPCPSPVRAALPLARRLEALRRVISFRDDYAHRCARSLARVARQNTGANAPRIATLRPWTYIRRRGPSGERMVEDSMRLAEPLAQNGLELFNARWIEPG